MDRMRPSLIERFGMMAPTPEQLKAHKRMREEEERREAAYRASRRAPVRMSPTTRKHRVRAEIRAERKAERKARQRAQAQARARR